MEEFSRELHARVASCDYKDPDEQMCDRFVVGLRDMELRQKLELIDDLTLDQAVSLARRHEQVKSQLAEQELHREVSEAKATASRGATAKSGRKRRQKAKKGATSETQKCQRCGYEAHQQGQRCPASGQSCNKCKKRGHFASVCQSTDEVTSQEQGTAGANCFLGAVDGEPTGAWYEPLQLNGHTVRFKIDTGADVSVVSSATWRTLGKPTLKPTQVQLSSPGGKLHCLGEFTSNVKCKDRTYTESVVVIENSNQISLLAREAATRMGLVARLEEVQHFGQMDTEPVEIKLRGDATPYCVTTARKVPFPLMDAVKAELDKMLEDGIVREVTEPTDWCSPMVPVVKASGGMRICVDVSDALSRKPLNTTNADDIELSSEVQAYVDAVESGWPTSPGRLEEIRRATEDDRELRAVADFVINGWPQRQDAVPASLYPYYHVRSDLSVADGLLIYRDRIVIPVALRSEMLKKLHETHQHISKTRERAAGAIWWPHISKDIKVMVESCAVCQQHRVTQREQPLKPVPLPERPWAQLGADLFEYKKKMFLVVVDYYSRWIEVKQLTTTTSASVISRLKAIFTTFGIPDVLITDNGPQFSAGEFAAFAKNWGFGHHTTNPYKPQENGMAERAVRTAKELLRLEDPELGLLNYRATPHSSTGVSPAMALMGRQVQTRLPVLSRHLMPSTPNDSIRQRDEVAKQSYKKYYDARHGARALPSLDPGDQVRCKLDNQKTWSAPAQVVKTSGDNRSVTVSTGPEGNVYRRSRKHLQPVPVQQEPTTEHVKPATASGNAEPVKDKPPATISDTDTQYRSRVSGRVIRTPLRYQE